MYLIYDPFESWLKHACLAESWRKPKRQADFLCICISGPEDEEYSISAGAKQGRYAGLYSWRMKRLCSSCGGKVSSSLRESQMQAQHRMSTWKGKLGEATRESERAGSVLLLLCSITRLSSLLIPPKHSFGVGTRLPHKSTCPCICSQTRFVFLSWDFSIYPSMHSDLLWNFWLSNNHCILALLVWHLFSLIFSSTNMVDYAMFLISNTKKKKARQNLCLSLSPI